MKIGITCYPTYGGSGAVAAELGVKLAARGHEIHFISYAHPFRLPHFVENVYFHEVDVGRYPLFEYPPYSLALAAEMHEVAEKRELDLLHVHYAIPHATSAWIAREMLGSEHPVRLVTTLHGTDITLVGQERSFEAITRFSIAKSDGLTAVSEYLKRETVQHFHVPAEDIEVIPNFVDPEAYGSDHHPCHRDRFVNPEERMILHISNFRSVKRLTDVVRIFARIAREVPARLVLAGDGPERHEAENEADLLGCGDRLVFLGKQDSVAELFACADLFLLPSATESFGLSALEAMASGVPVIATDVGGLPEVVIHGTTGFLSPVGDTEGMAAGALDILRDDVRRKAMSRAAEQVARERFSSDRVVPMYEDYYRSVLAKAPVPATIDRSDR